MAPAKVTASREFTIEVSVNIGSVSATVQSVLAPKAFITLAHGAGAGKDHPFMNALAVALLKESIGTVRFNFPYLENGKRRPDVGSVAMKTVEVVMRRTHELFPGVPLFGAGKSFGGRMTSQQLSKESPPWLKGIVFFGFPLHPAGAPATDRANHLSLIKIPMLFLQGSRDALADIQLTKAVVKKLPGATLKVFEGADHSFKASGKENQAEALALEASSWIDAVLLNDK